jgi:hypothetical protein
MKRLFLILAVLSLFVLGCSEAETVFPGDEAFYNPLPAEGTVTVFTATVGNISEDNPYITILFSSRIDPATVVFDTTVIVEYPAGVTTLIEGAPLGYHGIVNSSKIDLDLSPVSPISGNSVRVILTSANKAFVNNAISLTPVDQTRLLP